MGQSYKKNMPLIFIGTGKKKIPARRPDRLFSSQWIQGPGASIIVGWRFQSIILIATGQDAAAAGIKYMIRNMFLRLTSLKEFWEK